MESLCDEIDLLKEKIKELSRFQDQIQGKKSFSRIEPVFKNDFEGEPLVFLHPNEERDYTDEELRAISQRPFSTRLYITGKNVCGETVWLRTRHTDNAEFTSHFLNVRDAIKASIATKNYTAAKTCLAEMLTMYFDMRKDEYYTSACTLASGLSRVATSTSFEVAKDMVEDANNMSAARMTLVLMMEIVFSKIKTKRFLVEGNHSNIFRLAHCMTKYERARYPLVYAFFSLTLQVSLVVYLFAEIVSQARDGGIIDSVNTKLIPLGIFTMIFIAMIAFTEIKSALSIRSLYGRRMGFLKMSDLLVNVIIPFLLVFLTAWVIIIADSFIEAVLNTAALLFVHDIDDMLPYFLGLDSGHTVQNYLIDQSMLEYDELFPLNDENVRKQFSEKGQHPADIDFHDIFVTNTPERGSSPVDGLHLGPYEIKEGLNGNGNQVVVSKFISDDCLLRKVEWSYTSGFPNTTRPRVGYLKLWKLDGSDPIVVKEKSKRELMEPKDGRITTFKAEGVFLITLFQMSDSVLKLRICGSKTNEDFIKACEYYSLWNIDSSAMSLLRRRKSPVEKESKTARTRLSTASIILRHPFKQPKIEAQLNKKLRMGFGLDCHDDIVEKSERNRTVRFDEENLGTTIDTNLSNVTDCTVKSICEFESGVEVATLDETTRHANWSILSSASQ